MEWFIFALIAPFLWAFNNVIDKFLLDKHIKGPIAYQVLISLFNGISVIIILSMASISTNFYGFILGIISSILGVIAVIFYNRSLIDEEASRVIPLVYISSIFVPILAYIFLGEVFNFQKYLGIILIFIGGALISFKKIVKKWHFSPTVKFILISAFLWGASSIISKYTLGFIDYFSLTLWQLMGYLIFGPLFLLSKKVRTRFLNDVKRFNKKVFLLLVVNALIYLIALLSFLFATSIGSVSLVYAVVSTQPFFIFTYMLIITKMAPRIIKEEIDKSTILLKIIAICLIFLGTVFIGG